MKVSIMPGIGPWLPGLLLDLNILSIRSVMKKPPTTLLVAATSRNRCRGR